MSIMILCRSIRSVPLLGLDNNSFDDEGLNLFSIDMLLQWWGRIGECQDRRLRINDEAKLSMGHIAANISRIDFSEWALAVIQIHFCFSLNKVFSVLGRLNPLSIILASTDAHVDEVSCIRQGIPLRIFCLFESINSTPKVRFLSLYITEGNFCFSFNLYRYSLTPKIFSTIFSLDLQDSFYGFGISETCIFSISVMASSRMVWDKSHF